MSNETQQQEGRLEALSLIVRAVVTAREEARSGALGPTLIQIANRYFLDTPFETRTVDFRIGFEREFKQIVAILDAPSLIRPVRGVGKT